MVETKRAIFRESALEHHIQKREKDILPRVVSPPIFLLLWVLLAMFITAGAIAWSGQVSTYATGWGVVVATDNHSRTTKRLGGESEALVFLPPTLKPKLHTGLPAHLFLGLGSASVQITRTIDIVEPKLISPEAARTQYNLDSNMATVITAPSVVMKIRLGASFAPSAYAGAAVRADVEVGKQRIISLLPGLASLNGE